ncbi:MAG: TdeIII family type II restriction endonuclease [Candidatus Berkelbacteria bacterium]|nr:TdeIII family type II restriction endonuclease [Candidatus Berkelbacteria bacterium]
MPFTKEQKSEAIAIIKNAIIEKIDKYRLVGDIKPFHERLFSKKRIRETSFFHSCSTTLGVTLFQNIAYLISKGNRKFKNAEKQFKVSGEFSNKAKTLIEDIIYDLGRKKKDTKKRNPDIEKEIKAILKVSRGGKESTQIADLFLTDDKNEEIYIEIKTTKPNKGEVEKAKRTLLKIVALGNKPVKFLLVWRTILMSLKIIHGPFLRII